MFTTTKGDIVNKIDFTGDESGVAKGLHRISLGDVSAWAAEKGFEPVNVTGDLLAGKLDPRVIPHND